MPAYAWLAVSYLLGSIPAALIAGKWLQGIDLRRYGSGNLGATNVYRVLGLRAAIAVFVFDLAKGVVPAVFFLRWTTGPHGNCLAFLYGLAAIIGHIRPIYLGGKGGGKGVATASGVFLAITPVPMLVALIVWVCVFALTRYVSLASLFAAGALPFAVAIWNGPRALVVVVAATVSLFVIWTHRANIARLRAGTEPRIDRARAS